MTAENTSDTRENWGKAIIEYLPETMRNFVLATAPIITIGVLLTFFFSSLRIYIVIEAGVIYDRLPDWTLIFVALPLIVGPIISWKYELKTHLKEYTLVIIAASRLLIEIIPHPLVKFVFAIPLVILSISLVLTAIPVALKKYGYQTTTVSIISAAIIDISLRAPTLSAEPAIENNWYSHVLVILTTGFFLIEALVFFDQTNNQALQIIAGQKKQKEKQHGVSEGFVFIQGIMIYYLFYGNAGLIAQGFRITNSLATILLLTWYLLLTLLMYYIGITFRDEVFYSLNYAVVISSAVMLLVGTYMVPWSHFLLYPAPFFASLSLFFIIDRAVLTSREIDIKLFSKGASISLIITLTILFGYVYFEKIWYILVYIVIFGVISFWSVRSYRRSLNERKNK